MKAQELIQEIEKVGGSVQLRGGDRLRIETPRGSLTDDVKEALAVHKQEILKTLKDIQKANQPYISDGVLVIPFESEPRFRWWAGGQSVLETLRELKAPADVIALYCPGGSV